MFRGLVTAMSSIRDNDTGLSSPLVKEIIERVLQGGGDGPVVLRGDKDEAIERGNDGGPGARVGVGVVGRGVRGREGRRD